jgi:hypothetical protein
MPTTSLPESKEKAAEISRKIANTRPSTRDKDAPEGNVSGGFNQKRDQLDPAEKENSVTEGDGQ